MLNLFMLYSLIKRLVLPFDQWPAYKLGIIDAEGKALISRKDFTTQEQHRAYTHYDIMIRNMKRLLGTVPAGKKMLASYAAALWLIRENKRIESGELLTEGFLETDIEQIMENIRRLSEDEAGSDPVTNQTGNIEGMDMPLIPKKNRRDNETDDEVLESILKDIFGGSHGNRH